MTRSGPSRWLEKTLAGCAAIALGTIISFFPVRNTKAQSNSFFLDVVHTAIGMNNLDPKLSNKQIRENAIMGTLMNTLADRSHNMDVAKINATSNYSSQNNASTKSYNYSENNGDTTISNSYGGRIFNTDSYGETPYFVHINNRTAIYQMYPIKDLNGDGEIEKREYGYNKAVYEVGQDDNAFILFVGTNLQGQKITIKTFEPSGKEISSTSDIYHEHSSLWFAAKIKKELIKNSGNYKSDIYISGHKVNEIYFKVVGVEEQAKLN